MMQIRAVIDAESEDLDSDQRSRVEQLIRKRIPDTYRQEKIRCHCQRCRLAFL
jgi:hypothetical protein